MLNEIIEYHEKEAQTVSKSKAQGLKFEQRILLNFHENTIDFLLKLKKQTEKPISK
jgi:hypothetical protein